jgi:hypothetical protein
LTVLQTAQLVVLQQLVLAVLDAVAAMANASLVSRSWMSKVSASSSLRYADSDSFMFHPLSFRRREQPAQLVLALLQLLVPQQLLVLELQLVVLDVAVQLQLLVPVAASASPASETSLTSNVSVSRVFSS